MRNKPILTKMYFRGPIDKNRKLSSKSTCIPTTAIVAKAEGSGNSLMNHNRWIPTRSIQDFHNQTNQFLRTELKPSR